MYAHTRRARRTIRPVHPGRRRPAPAQVGTGTTRGPVLQERALAAILFVDVVGYTALVHDDEAAARDARTLFRQVVARHVTGHGGEVVQHFGDGALCSFRSALEGVYAARDIRSDLALRSGPDVRMGLHVADVVRDAEGLFGDGVNVASRIQGLARPGQILLSDAVARELSGHPDVDVRPLGRFRLKNLPDPMKVGLLTGGADDTPTGLAAWLGSTRRRLRLHAVASVLAAVTAVEMAGAMAILPDWAMRGALAFALVQALGSSVGMRPASN